MLNIFNQLAIPRNCLDPIWKFSQKPFDPILNGLSWVKGSVPAMCLQFYIAAISEYLHFTLIRCDQILWNGRIGFNKY